MLLDYDFLRKHTVVYQLNKHGITDMSNIVLWSIHIDGLGL